MRAKDFRQSAWQSLKGKWGVCVLAFLIYDVISGALGALSRYGVGAVAIILIEGPLLIGQSKISLKVARGENAEVGMLFDGFKDFARAFVLHLINTIFIVLWTLLLIIPGIIKSYAYSMSYYILLDDPNISANDARKKSMEMMKGNKWRLFCLQFSFIGWILLSILTLGILLFWVSPYMQVAQAKFYLSLLPEEEQKDGAVDDGVVVDGLLDSDLNNNSDPFANIDENKNDFNDGIDFSKDEDEFKF